VRGGQPHSVRSATAPARAPGWAAASGLDGLVVRSGGAQLGLRRGRRPPPASPSAGHVRLRPPADLAGRERHEVVDRRPPCPRGRAIDTRRTRTPGSGRGDGRGPARRRAEQARCGDVAPRRRRSRGCPLPRRPTLHFRGRRSSLGSSTTLPRVALDMQARERCLRRDPVCRMPSFAVPQRPRRSTVRACRWAPIRRRRMSLSEQAPLGPLVRFMLLQSALDGDRHDQPADASRALSSLAQPSATPGGHSSAP